MEIKEKKLVEEKYFLQAIDDLGKGSKLLWIIFIINLSTTLLFGINSMSYVFIGEIPEYWCSTPEFTSTNWTKNQINNISIVDACQRYDYNYTQLVELGYEKFVQHVKNFESKPKIVSCSSFIFEDNGRSTIVSEWQLVCDKKLHRANTFLVYSLGIMGGSAILGVYADKYGRKNSLIISIILHTIAGPLSALVPWFWAYVTLKFFTGMSLGAMYSSAFTLFSEVVKSNRRKLFVGVLDSAFSVGTFFLIGMAYFLPNWRQLQMAISCFVLPIVILIWFMPESPRWLISQNRHDEAQKVIEKYHKSFVMTPISIVGNSTNEPTMSSEECHETPNENKSFFYRNFESLRILFTHPDLRKKIIIMNFSYYVTAAAGYSLAFNVENLKSNRYVYMSILSAIEILGNSIISVVLLFFSCRKLLVISYTVAFILMITILAIPEENINPIIGLALAAKFCFSGNFTANLVLFSKLFPSNVRNTAFGTCILMGQTGSMTAPYIVDLLGNVAWWAPTTLCGILSLMAGIFCFAIPQTKIDN